MMATLQKLRFSVVCPTEKCELHLESVNLVWVRIANFLKLLDMEATMSCECTLQHNT